MNFVWYNKEVFILAIIKTVLLFLKYAISFNSLYQAVVSYFKTPILSVIPSLSKTGSGNNGQQLQFPNDRKAHFSIHLPDRLRSNSCNTDFHYLFLEHFLLKTIFAYTRDILPLCDSLVPYKYIPCYRHKYILFLVYFFSVSQ